MIFRLPTIQYQAHKLMVWGVETTWSQMGRWDYSQIAWHFEKALHETTFDRESTRLHPITSRSSFAAEILSSIKKSKLSLKKLHSREVQLFCVAKLKGEDGKYFLEGTAPAWVKILTLSDKSDQATLRICKNDEWFSLAHQPGSSTHVVRYDIAECSHQLEVDEPSVCRFEPLSEWLSSFRPSGIAFNSEGAL
jgi:hypothetical protein